MLRQRVFTAIILIPLVVWGVLELSTEYIAIVFGIFIILGAWEWSMLSRIRTNIARITYVAAVISIMFLCWIFPQKDMLLHYVMKITFLWWLLCLLWLFNIRFASENTLQSRAIKMFAGIMLLVPSWLALISLHTHVVYGPYWVLFIIVMVWVADSGAYFSGKKWGKNKLAPHISPGKTLEGVVGALLLVLLYSMLSGWLLELKSMTLVKFTIVSLVVAGFSVVGDLFVSVMKRHANIKDSGMIFPGHGGVMDRIDSLTAAAPLFVLGLSWMNIAP